MPFADGHADAARRQPCVVAETWAGLDLKESGHSS
jgi:hypothetical protein